MRELPREEWDHQGGMKDPTHPVVQVSVDGKRTMAAFVSQDPDADADQALQEAVHCPADGAVHWVLDLGDESQCGINEGASHCYISHNVAQRPCGGWHEAVGRDGVPDSVNIRESESGRNLQRLRDVLSEPSVALGDLDLSDRRHICGEKEMTVQLGCG